MKASVLLYAKARQSGLYMLLFVLSAFLFITALGPGLFGNALPGPYSWQHKLFELLCHQDAARSFSLNGQPMAVCARCLGVYAAFLGGIVIMPAISNYAELISKKAQRVLIGIVFINAIDIAGNVAEIWTNTLYSRLLLGALFGLFASLLLTNEFFKKQDNGG